ncbi:SMI1/KNR4 family protein [Pseudomonas luteola]|uniref:SMI1/KNR4 family protein n=1 Tax=Pseudomonas TaxID=286 RepID=UPI00388DC0BC
MLYKAWQAATLARLDTNSHQLNQKSKRYYFHTDQDLYVCDIEYEPLRFNEFKPIALISTLNKERTKYIGGCYQAMIHRNAIPRNILPFGLDDGGNFFCLNLDNNSAGYYAMDSYNNEKSNNENHKDLWQELNYSFSDFLDALKTEDNI